MNQNFKLSDVQRELICQVNNSSKIVTLKHFSVEYLAFIKSNHSSSYLISNEISFKHLNNYFPESFTLVALTQSEIDGFFNSLKKRATKGYKVYYRNLKAAFNKAIDWGYISSNPLSKIKLVKEQCNQLGFITEEDLNKILIHIESMIIAPEQSNKLKLALSIFRDIIEIAFFTGMRLGELNNLRWENVKFDKGYFVAGDDKSATKHKKQRIIPIENRLIETLRKRKLLAKGKEEYVFSLNGTRLFSNDYISKSFKHICRKVGFDESIRFNSLRHSFASNLALKGVSPFQLRKLLGLSSIAAIERYSQLNLDLLRQAIGKFSKGDSNG